ncbi:hypothetical protein [Erythrobacter sp. EC-HK427]|uniref:hypothetical protein n=1 Tax=Erythrobacter sp. EC-HK427 TaxID=2038396 RepID=UPI0012570B9F|nr:hypothetical protein [Erythrobacter sp. EC-HK427]VVS96061.1 conserved hypothetical protein [Erythrobacter sp. EC-HK427]
MIDPVLPTRNEAWGFFGTTAEFTDADAAWSIATAKIAEATYASEDGVRDFLDSRHGRHFADDVHNAVKSGLPIDEAIDAAIVRWMGWSISRATASEHGIPVGLPYLTGFVGLYEIMADA